MINQKAKAAAGSENSEGDKSETQPAHREAVNPERERERERGETQNSAPRSGVDEQSESNEHQEVR
jgi:hypothetical protein